jgi:hypothetical protein
MLQVELSFAAPTTVDESRIDRAFAEFHAANPDVYRCLVSLARDLRARGHQRLGIGMLFEVVRWQRHMTTVDADGFKLNNNYRSRYARLIMADEPDLAGAFELRELGR